MGGDAAMLAGAGAALAGIAVLRLSWGRQERSARLNVLAWLLLGGAAVLGWIAAGAWGLAVAMLVATGAACLLLAHAAFEQPRMVRRAKRAVRAEAGAAPRGAWGRGLLTFALTGPLALAVSVALVLALRLLALRWPVAEANGNVMVLALVPLVWALLTFAMLMAEQRRTQIAMLALPLAGAMLPLLLMGNAA